MRILKSLAASRVSKNGIPQRTILISLRRLRNRMGCVYLLTCLPTGKYYVGKTVKTVRVRWQEHVADVKRGHRGCPYLHAAIRKYGPENFFFSKFSQRTIIHVSRT